MGKKDSSFQQQQALRTLPAFAARSDRNVPLPEDFQPGLWDIICQGGKESYDHVGNRRFRICIDNNLQTYKKAKSKYEKSAVVSAIVDSIESSSAEGGGFVRKDADKDRWYQVGDIIAREKVGHALRDAIKLRKTIAERRKKRQEARKASGTSNNPLKKRQRISKIDEQDNNLKDDHDNDEEQSEEAAVEQELCVVRKIISDCLGDKEDGEKTDKEKNSSKKRSAPTAEKPEATSIRRRSSSKTQKATSKATNEHPSSAAISDSDSSGNEKRDEMESAWKKSLLQTEQQFSKEASQKKNGMANSSSNSSLSDPAPETLDNLFDDDDDATAKAKSTSSSGSKTVPKPPAFHIPGDDSTEDMYQKMLQAYGGAGEGSSAVNMSLPVKPGQQSTAAPAAPLFYGTDKLPQGIDDVYQQAVADLRMLKGDNGSLSEQPAGPNLILNNNNALSAPPTGQAEPRPAFQPFLSASTLDLRGATSSGPRFTNEELLRLLGST